MRRPGYGYDGERFVAYWWFVGWWALSFGLHVSVRHWNIEIHLPFGFLRIGRQDPMQWQFLRSLQESGNG